MKLNQSQIDRFLSLGRLNKRISEKLDEAIQTIQTENPKLSPSQCLDLALTRLEKDLGLSPEISQVG